MERAQAEAFAAVLLALQEALTELRALLDGPPALTRALPPRS